MKIYRVGETDPIEVADVTIDESTVYLRKLMAEHEVDANWISASKLDIRLNDYIVIGSEKFYLNRPVQVDKVNNFTYRHTAKFEGEVYSMYHKIFMDEGSADFSYFGDPALYLQLLIDNLNSIESGWTYNLDLPVTYGPKAMSFNEVSCRVALTQIMEEFELEFRLVQKEIIVRQDVGFPSAYSFEYGRFKGLYALSRENTNDKDVVTRLYAFGGDKNIPLSYRGGARRLVFETGDPAVRYLEANTEIYGIREGSITFPDIYPRRTGSVTEVTAKNKIIDESLDFNINDHLISGVVAKIVFKSGALSGYEFDIQAYNHATKEITFIEKEEANGAIIPDDGSFQPDEEDEYTLININMPDEYVEAAEAELLEAAEEAHVKMKSPQVIYGLDLDEKYVRTNGVSLDCGMQVTVKDEELGLDETIRIYSISFPLVNPANITAQISDVIPLTNVERIIKEIKHNSRDVITVDRTREENYREGAIRMRNLQTKIYDPDGYFNGENIRPNSIETLMLSVGAKSQNFLLNLVEIEANYQGDPNAIRISGGFLIHLEVQIEGLGYVWEMDPNIVEDLIPTSYYYVYAKCNKSALTGTWVLSETPIGTESVAGFYHFWLGLLYPVNDNDQRYFMFTKGMTYIVGDTITTGRIQSLDGLNFFDVTRGTFNLGNEESGLDWDITNPGALTIRGAVIASAVLAEDGFIANLKVKSLKTGTEGKRIEILAFADEEETEPLHNLKFYDEDGNLALTLDTDVDTDNASTPSAGFRIEKDGSSRKALLTQNGMMSSGSFLTDTSLPSNQHYGSIIGILKEKFFTAFGIRAGVIGMDATTRASDNQSFGGWFNTLFAGGLFLGVIQRTASYTVEDHISWVSCYNTSGTITISLPTAPNGNRIIFIKRCQAGGVTVSGNGNNIQANGGPQSTREVTPRGLTLMLIWDGTYWQSNGL